MDLTAVLRKSKEAARKHRAKGGASKTGPLGGRGRVVRGRGRGGPGGAWAEDRGRKRSRYDEGPGPDRSKYPRYHEDRRGPPPPPPRQHHHRDREERYRGEARDYTDYLRSLAAGYPPPHYLPPPPRYYDSLSYHYQDRRASYDR